MEGKANCQGYADLFFLLGTIAGYQIDYLSGWVNTKEGAHIWNTIYLNRKFYLVDVTAGDSEDSWPHHPTHTFFNIGRDRLPKDRLAWYADVRYEDISATTDNSLSYFSNAGLDFGYATSDVGDAMNYLIWKRQNGVEFGEVMILNRTVSPEDVNNAMIKAVRPSHPRSAWTYDVSHQNGNTIVWLRWDQF